MKNLRFKSSLFSHQMYGITSFLFLILVSLSVFSMEKEEPNSKQLIKITSIARKEKKSSLKKKLKLKAKNWWKSVTKKQSEQSHDDAIYQKWPFTDEITIEIIKKLIVVGSKEKLKETAKAVLSFASATRIFYNLFKDPLLMKGILNSVAVDDAFSLAYQMKKMRVMKSPEMLQWHKNALGIYKITIEKEMEKIRNSENLFELIRKTDKPGAEKLLENKNIDIDYFEKASGLTPLMEAANLNNKEIVNLLLQKGADVNKQNMLGYSAIFCGNFDIRQILINAGADINITNCSGVVPLIYSIGLQDTKLIKIFLAAGATRTINNKDESGRTALSYAAKNIKLVKILLDAGADPKITKDILTIVARHGDARTLTMLINAGADINGKNASGYTPLMIAAEKGKEDMIEILLKARAKIDEIDNIEGQDALIKACRYGHSGVVRILLDFGAPVNHTDRHGQHALIKAIITGHEDIVHMLLNAGSDIDLEDEKGWNSSTWAVYYYNTKIIKMLKNAAFLEE
jgi:ankyrin repeat protein